MRIFYKILAGLSFYIVTYLAAALGQHEINDLNWDSQVFQMIYFFFPFSFSFGYFWLHLWYKFEPKSIQ